MRRDFITHLGYRQTIIPAVISATKISSLIDAQGTYGTGHVVSLGTPTGTLDGTNYLRLVLQEGDLADGSDMAPVADNNALQGAELVEGEAAGTFAVINDANQVDDAFRVGYRGCKRYTRVVVEYVGTAATVGDVGVSAIGLLKDTEYPAADQPAQTGL